jgi:hypothetical protein
LVTTNHGLAREMLGFNSPTQEVERVSPLVLTCLILGKTGKLACLQYVIERCLITTNEAMARGMLRFNSPTHWLERVSPLVLACLILGNTGKPACLNCTNQRLFILNLDDVKIFWKNCRCSDSVLKGIAHYMGKSDETYS